MPGPGRLPASARPARSGAALAAAFGLSALCGAAAAAEDYSQWTHAGDIYVNTAADGADVAGTVTDFPLLLRLDATNFDFSLARGDGRDVRFAAASGRHLPYQVERWDSAGARAEIWILADTLLGHRADQRFVMHWGRPAAPDSARPGAVFAAANGFLQVFHLGGSALSRPNAVAGYQAAIPFGYDGNESVPGVIGLCDSLAVDEYLRMNEGFSEVGPDFTFSVWAYPTSAGHYARLLDIGNGEWSDNIVVARRGTTDVLYLDVFNGNAAATAEAGGGTILLNQWQHFAVTVAGTAARIYRNGALVRSQTLAHGIRNLHRGNAFLGKSNWAADPGFTGKLDEPRISRTARNADWVKLSFATQRPGQAAVGFQRRMPCVSSFRAPRDTAAAEGRAVTLSGKADCAASVSWTPVAGPTPRIFDPGSPSLQVVLPRVPGDTTLVYRFVARYGDSVRSKDVRVHVREAIPDPVFTLPNPPPWDGKDSLVLEPVIQNLAAIRASRDSAIAWSWALQGVPVDTVVRKDALVLRGPEEPGPVNFALCLDNGGGPVCRQSQVTITASLASVKAPARLPKAAAAAPSRDARGRRIPERGAAPAPAYPDGPPRR